MLTANLLYGSDGLFDKFIDEQITLESKLLDQNLTKKERIKLVKEQESAYQNFFLHIASDKESKLNVANPYTKEINKLKIQISYNRSKGNSLIIARDKVKLQEYQIRNGIRKILTKVLQFSNTKSKDYFEDKISEIITNAFDQYKPLKKTDYYKLIEQNPDSQNAILLKKELKKLEYMEGMANAFSSQLIDKSSEIYTARRMSNSILFTLVEKIDSLPISKKLDHYLSYINMDTKILVVAIIAILIILILNFTINLIINATLRYKKVNDEDTEFVHNTITRLIYLITTVMIVNMTLVLYFGIDTTSITISKFFAVVYIILTALLLYRLTNVIAYFKIEKLQKGLILKKEVLNLAIKIINVIIFIAAIMGIMIVLGVNLTALLSGLGIGGFAIAFAAKDTISNIFGSVSILLSDLFEQGDWIETSEVNGTVVEIGLRATTLRTFDNALISVPNFKLANEEIKNWNRRTIGRRIKMEIGVTYESDFEDIKKAVVDIREMLKSHPDIAGTGTKYTNKNNSSKMRASKLVSIYDYKGVKTTQLVFLDQYADSCINILVYCFSKSVVWEEWLQTKEDVMYKIADILKKNHLKFAYPALAIHNVSDKETEALADESRKNDSNELPQNKK